MKVKFLRTIQAFKFDRVSEQNYHDTPAIAGRPAQTVSVDLASRLVTIRKGEQVACVPFERVEYWTPMPEESTKVPVRSGK